MIPAPTCPDCGSICVHPLTMPVECADCGGEGYLEHGGMCPSCNGTGKVAPPPPTDEQIFGRECETCASPSVVGACHDCGGTGRVGAAENRWTCLGGDDLLIPLDGGREAPYGQCPGRTDVRAKRETWAATIRAWRTRTKTTVMRPGDAWVPWNNQLPDGVDPNKGTLTIVVTFVPEE